MQLAHNGIDHATAAEAAAHEARPVVAVATHEETTATVGHETTSEDAGVLASLGINGPLFLFQLLNFAIVAGIVWFLILKPLTKKMEERKNLIDESLDRAKEIETNYQMSEVKFQESLDHAKQEANAIIASAQEEATRTQEKMKEKTKEEVAGLVLAAKKNIETEKEAMRADVRKETVTIVVAALEKILGEKMDAKKDAKFIEDILKDLR